jgi:hypothetical protein
MTNFRSSNDYFVMEASLCGIPHIRHTADGQAHYNATDMERVHLLGGNITSVKKDSSFTGR